MALTFEVWSNSVVGASSHTLSITQDAIRFIREEDVAPQSSVGKVLDLSLNGIIGFSVMQLPPRNQGQNRTKEGEVRGRVTGVGDDEEETEGRGYIFLNARTLRLPSRQFVRDF